MKPREESEFAVLLHFDRGTRIRRTLSAPSQWFVCKNGKTLNFYSLQFCGLKWKPNEISEYTFLSNFSSETRICRTDYFFWQWFACEIGKNCTKSDAVCCASFFISRARILHATRSSCAHKNSLPKVLITKFHSYVERVLSNFDI